MSRSGPAGALVLLFAVCLLWLSVMRGLLVALHWDRVRDVADAWRVFPIGLRMDVILLCELFAVPTLIHLLLPGRAVRERMVAVLLTVFAAILVIMELCTPGFIAEYDRRPDRVFYEYLVYPREVLGTLLKTYPLELAVVFLFAIVLIWGFWRLSRRSLSRAADWPWRRRALAFPVLAVLLFLGARSSLGHRPANISTAAFSSNNLLNQLAVSSTYSLFNAIYTGAKEVSVAALYGRMDWPEVVARVHRYTGLPEEAYRDPSLPTLHVQGGAGGREGAVPADAPPPGPCNLVIVMLESMGAEFVGSLGGLPLTPNLDRLSQEGLWFTRLYATGTRTVRGLEAVLLGFPPTPAPSVIKLPLAQHGFFTLARLLKQNGYATEFIYGGVSNFDNMGGFFLGNGFDRVIEQKDFESPVLLGTWGVSDEDLAARAHQAFLAHGDRPFFALLLSTSNHVPFEFPPGRIQLHEEPAQTRNNAVKYTDYAVGRLFELARTAPYFRNTVFLVVADHDARVFGSELVPVKRFHIPALIIGPGVPRRHEDRIASQIDLAPTLLGLLNLRTTSHPMIGRDMLNLPGGVPGRALMQYGDVNGFLAGDQLVVSQPYQPSRVFRCADDGSLVPADDNPELRRDALAHLLWADHSYREGMYRLPEP